MPLRPRLGAGSCMPDDGAGSDKEQIAGRVGFQAEYMDAIRFTVQ